MIAWITGNSGSGKTTRAIEYRKLNPGTIILDGDEMRKVWTDLGLSKQDRIEQNMRAARLAKMLSLQGFNVVVATICPYRALRAEIKELTDCEFIYLEGGKTGPQYPYEAEVTK